MFVVRHSYPWSDLDDMVSVYDSAEAMMKKLELIGECQWDTGETVKIERVDVLDVATMNERLDRVRESRKPTNSKG